MSEFWLNYFLKPRFFFFDLKNLIVSLERKTFFCLVVHVLKTSRRLLLFNIVRYTFPKTAVCLHEGVRGSNVKGAKRPELILIYFDV